MNSIDRHACLIAARLLSQEAAIIHSSYTVRGTNRGVYFWPAYGDGPRMCRRYVEMRNTAAHLRKMAR